MTWHGVKQILNVSLWKRIPYCLYGSKSSSFENAGRESGARRRPPKSHTCSIGDMSGEWADQGRSCMFWTEQSSNSFYNMCACIILLKDSSRDVLKEGNDLRPEHFKDVPVGIEITLNSWQIG
ncbi:hypothetical protein TNCV_3103971 [Trichonephila clavipes]|nr:hypothetical protein TNCV_3103971 [Trichonephila clavipes]